MTRISQAKSASITLAGGKFPNFLGPRKIFSYSLVITFLAIFGYQVIAHNFSAHAFGTATDAHSECSLCQIAHSGKVLVTPKYSYAIKLVGIAGLTTFLLSAVPTSSIRLFAFNARAPPQ